MTLGEALVTLLEAHGVDTVFGIPGVHTIELYRGLAGSTIRHVTPRHEQGAGFMADGYARVSGKPGVVFVITGPGLTNTLTAMAQARADSVPMLVISGVNARPTLGQGLGYLHELPDQRGMTDLVALYSQRVEESRALPPALRRAFSVFASGRPGPVHIEIPLDVMALPADGLVAEPVAARPPALDPGYAVEVARRAEVCQRPLILAGGGAKRADAALTALAEKLDAPVVTTTNGRGLLCSHPLGVPASPSLEAVRSLMAGSDLVIAAGTEFGPTDYDMYANGRFVLPGNLVRIDIDRWQLSRRPASMSILADAGEAVAAIAGSIDKQASRGGARRAEEARIAARGELLPYMLDQLDWVEAIRNALPHAIVVGDSTQPVYAANLYYDHDRPGGWFNAATGYGALGYAAPAAVGAALAAPRASVVCLTGDGGFQYTLAELGSAVEAGVPIAFVVWNNRGYREIESAMIEAGVEPIGVKPVPPDFRHIAAAWKVPYGRAASPAELGDRLRGWRATGGVALVEIQVD
ncbi:MAG: 5-guanidino-2-oxopentanoate decarboxylase [Rhizobiaceae bacterium]